MTSAEPDAAGAEPLTEVVVGHDEVIVDPRRRLLILAAMCVALVAVVASVSGLNVAQQALAAQIKDARATADTGSAEGKARLRADIQTMVDGYGSQQKPATAVDPASQSQGMQQAAVASYLAMSLMR